jgi:hypothetical protein
LRLLADLAFHEQALFASVGEDGQAWSGRLLTIAHELEREVVERRLSQVAQSGRVDLRNRAYAWVLEALREIKAATRFLGITRFEEAERDEALFAPDGTAVCAERSAQAWPPRSRVKPSQTGSLHASREGSGQGMVSPFGALGEPRWRVRRSLRWPFVHGRGSG